MLRLFPLGSRRTLASLCRGQLSSFCSSTVPVTARKAVPTATKRSSTRHFAQLSSERPELSSVGILKSLRIKWQLYNLRNPWEFDPEEFVEVRCQHWEGRRGLVFAVCTLFQLYCGVLGYLLSPVFFFVCFFSGVSLHAHLQFPCCLPFLHSTWTTLVQPQCVPGCRAQVWFGSRLPT